MKIFTDIREWQTFHKRNMEPLGFVPTMGALHEGHRSLMTRSKAENTRTLVSIFINPTQFNNPDDLTHYPKTLEADTAMLEATGVDYVLLPDAEAMYPDAYAYKISEQHFSKQLCGAHRPGHFDGMLTVVMKLLLIARAQRAYFGEKDFQQLQLIQGMKEAFFMGTEIVPCPTVREADGLAMSSRNLRLTPEERAKAPLLYRTLCEKKPIADLRETLENAGFRVDYLEEHFGRRLVAAHLGKVRLIDNVEIPV